ncbi:fimbria/pilus periplasmic chaperone [Pseudomonas sp. CCM 7893]|uniref:Fimbria/pilus periplasmic chaperone n=1 Tax=Pseudomonas spelaei TaxID=1055469 RepID=A0A6I3W2D0_9PSED|nr:molecular chaperone [Pseudomonas spelaei]MUF03658.1 fimbria/pilus periplasmic chaperone [Pseudomonas spelaei]
MRPSKKRWSALVWPVLVMLCGLDAQAALTVIGTRFVYPADTTLLPIRVGNNAEQPILLQAWLDKGDAVADPGKLHVPFVLFPPIVRLEPQQRAALELRYTREPLPRDRESVFWINLLEVPAQSAGSEHRLQLSYRMRMKVLFRPEGLPGRPDQAAEQLSWGLESLPERTLKIGNRSAYYVSVAHLTLGSGPQAVQLEGITIEPYGTTRVALPDTQRHLTNGTPIHYDIVDDNGATFSANARIQD